MAGTPTLPLNREESGTHSKTPEKAAPPAHPPSKYSVNSDCHGVCVARIHLCLWKKTQRKINGTKLYVRSYSCCNTGVVPLASATSSSRTGEIVMTNYLPGIRLARDFATLTAVRGHFVYQRHVARRDSGPPSE